MLTVTDGGLCCSVSSASTVPTTENRAGICAQLQRMSEKIESPQARLSGIRFSVVARRVIVPLLSTSLSRLDEDDAVSNVFLGRADTDSLDFPLSQPSSDYNVLLVPCFGHRMEA